MQQKNNNDQKSYKIHSQKISEQHKFVTNVFNEMFTILELPFCTNLKILRYCILLEEIKEQQSFLSQEYDQVKCFEIRDQLIDKYYTKGKENDYLVLKQIHIKYQEEFKNQQKYNKKQKLIKKIDTHQQNVYKKQGPEEFTKEDEKYKLFLQSLNQEIIDFKIDLEFFNKRQIVDGILYPQIKDYGKKQEIQNQKEEKERILKEYNEMKQLFKDQQKEYQQKLNQCKRVKKNVYSTGKQLTKKQKENIPHIDQILKQKIQDINEIINSSE